MSDRHPKLEPEELEILNHFESGRLQRVSVQEIERLESAARLTLRKRQADQHSSADS